MSFLDFDESLIESRNAQEMRRPVIGFDAGDKDHACMVFGEVINGVLSITNIAHYPSPKACISCGSATQPCCGH